MLSNPDLKNILESKKGDLPNGLPELVSSISPPIDPIKVRAMRDAISAGEEANPKEVCKVSIFGSMEERMALRGACTTPLAIARNQDLNLSRLTRALRGDSTAKTSYENGRIIIPEILPEWALTLWQETAQAKWRTLDLHGPEFKAFARRVSGEPEDVFTHVTIAQYDPNQEQSLIAGMPLMDERSAFLTYAIGRKLLQEMQKLIGDRTWERRVLYQIADAEIREGVRLLSSPTPIGKHYRTVADNELRFQFAAQMVDDACLALNLPLGSSAKQKLLNRIIPSPWIQLAQQKLHRLLDPIAALRSEGKDEETVTAQVERFLFTPGALSQFIQDRQPKAIAVVDSVIPVEEPWPPQALIDSRKAALTKALESSPHRKDFDVKRHVRLFIRSVQDSEALFKRALDLIQQGVRPDAIAVELDARRNHSGFKPDARPQLPRVESSQQVPAKDVSALCPEVSREKASAPALAVGHSRRLLIRATLESYYSGTELDFDRMVRILTKLTNESEHLLDMTLQAMETGENLEQIVAALRQHRAPTISSSKASPAPVMSEALMEVLGVGIVAPEEELTRFSFAKSAQKAFKDGAVRHAVSQALERYVERPEIADVVKIKSVEHHVWELRLLRENLRVYFVKLSSKEIRILLVGSKYTQDQDIARLDAIYLQDQVARETLA